MRRFLVLVLLFLAGCGSKVATDESTSTYEATATTKPASPCFAATMTLHADSPINVANSPQQHSILLSVQNNGTADCALSGYPTVTIVGPGNDYTMHQQQNIKPTNVRLKKLEKAVFTITYLEASTEDGCNSGQLWQPTTINVKISEDSQPLSAKWTGDTMNNCQSGATHPGDFVSPFSNA